MTWPESTTIFFIESFSENWPFFRSSPNKKRLDQQDREGDPIILESVHYNLVQKIKQHFGGHNIMHLANLKEPTRIGPNFSNKIGPNLVGSFKFA